MKSLSVPIYDLSGKSVSTMDLSPAIFGLEPNQTLLHQAVVSHLANRRGSIAHTKDRAVVRGGGKKPWRQKGTGNARAGSSRSPIWRGGGITFGPSSERNFSVRMPQKMRHAALKSALSTKALDENIIILDTLDTLDGKTKSWAKAVAVLPKADKKKLIVDFKSNEIVHRSIRNLEGTKYSGLDGLNTYDVMRYPVLVLTKEAVEQLTTKLGAAKPAAEKPVTKAQGK